MNGLAFDDRLDLLGVLVGAFLILGALGALVGAPWATNPNLIAVVLQLLGIVLTIAVAVGLIWIVRQ